MKNKNVKLWQGLLMLVVGGIILFIGAPFVGRRFGLYGTLIAEWLLVVFAILILLVGRSKISLAIPFRKPKASQLFGTLLIWGGAYWIANLSTFLMGILFPQQVADLGSNLGQAFTQEAFWISILIIAVTPAICEEIMFRGVVLNSFSVMGNKWLMILTSAVIFGMFHGSIFRLLPPTILGIAMGYIFYETGNMLYNVLFHMVNNTIPLVLLYGMERFLGDEVLEMAESTVSEVGNEAFLTSFGSGLLFVGGALFCIYLGDFLLHMGQPGYDKGPFSEGKKKILILLIVISIACFLIGLLFIFQNAMSIFPEVMEGMNEMIVGVR